MRDLTRAVVMRRAALVALAALCEGYGLSPAPRCATRRAVGALLPAGCWLLGRDAAAGACLPSDLSEECIGVYKERSTDVTREDARAAGIRWAEQPTFAKPREAARALRRERATVTAWRRDGDLVNVGTSLLRVRPVVGAAAEAVGAKLDRETAKLWAKAVDASLFAFDAADVALGYATVWNSNLQPDFNMRICDSFDASSSAVLRELDESNRFVQKSAESTSM
jgi:hypothetical protein